MSSSATERDRRNPGFPWRSWFGRLARSRLLGHRSAMVGLVIMILVALVALAAPKLIRYDPLKHHLVERFRPPDREFWLGTDQFGRDLFSRIVWGTRVSLAVGLNSLVVGGAAGTAMGLVGGYLGGRLDVMMVRLIDLLLSFPSILVAIAVAGITGGGVTGVVLALAITLAPRFGRVVRGQAIMIREREYVVAAQAVGVPHWRIILFHVLPNCVGPLIVLTTLYLPYAIVVESSLSFLGVGVPADAATWGRIIADGRDYLHEAPWISVFPGLAMMVTTLGLNILGDGLRDLLDPKLRT